MQRSVSFAKRFAASSSTGFSADALKPECDYEEEMVLLFYNSMLNLIVDEWTVTEETGTVEEAVPAEEAVPEQSSISGDVVTTDFKDISAGELENISSIVAEGSKVSYTKKKRRSSKLKKKSKSDASQLENSDNSMYSNTDSRRSSTVRESSRAPSISIGGVSSRPPSISIGGASSVEPSKDSSSLTIEPIQISNWKVVADRENVFIKFKNGNIYCGSVHKKRFDGNGTFQWADGAVYEGDFKRGEITGRGRLFYKENSIYTGSFCKGILNGNGTIYIACTNVLYSGEWKRGKQNGKGWILYEPQNWYDGEWLNGIRHGKGLRQYNKSTRYQGNWQNGNRHGQGIMVWSNRDFYRGEWKDGVMDGFGEYTWNGFFQSRPVFPLLNSFEGDWVNGMRTGLGILHLGVNGGTRMAGQWVRNMKHGGGLIVCGNGKTIKGNLLFMYDKPVDAQLFEYNRYSSSIRVNSNIINATSKEKSETMPVTDTTCPENEKDLNGMNLFSEIPPTFSSQLNPLRIPIHSEARTVDLSHYLELVSTKYGIEYRTNLESSKQTDLNAELTSIKILEFEEKKLRFAITYHYLLLQAIYQRYAKMSCKEDIRFRPVLVRMHLRQLYIDTGVTQKMSLIDTDVHLLKNPDCGLESNHYPFERIYFWQFIYSLISVAWALYSDNSDEYKPDGILASIFTKFVLEDVEPNAGKFQNGATTVYINLLPLESTYRFYLTVGEPHSVRTFFHKVYSKFENICDEILGDGTVSYVKKGSNAVVNRLIYITDEPVIGEKPEEPIAYPFKEGVYESLRLFTKLKPKELLKCIGQECPRVFEDGVLINMDYKLSFLEFYNVLIAATLKIIENVEKMERRKRDMSMNVLAQAPKRTSKYAVKKFKK